MACGVLVDFPMRPVCPPLLFLGRTAWRGPGPVVHPPAAERHLRRAPASAFLPAPLGQHELSQFLRATRFTYHPFSADVPPDETILSDDDDEDEVEEDPQAQVTRS
jgi:hypothetical protein